MAHVIIPDEEASALYANQTGTGPYAFSFTYFAKTDLRVRVGGVDIAQGGFTDAGNALEGGFDGGSITLVVPAAAQDVFISREKKPVRITDFASAPISAKNLNTELDILTAICADALRKTKNAILRSPEEIGEVTIEFPPKATRANKVLAFDVNGVLDFTIPRVNVDIVAGISDEVVIVAGISANVSAVAGIAADVTSVAGVTAHVATLGPIAPDITAVAGISANVTAVAGVSGDVTIVAGSIASVNTAAANIAGINTAAANIANINAAPQAAIDAAAARDLSEAWADAAVDAPVEGDPLSIVTFNPATAINLTTNVITIAGNTLQNYDQVTYRNGGGGNVSVGGLVHDAEYFIRDKDVNGAGTFTLAATLEGAAIDLLAGATGTSHQFLPLRSARHHTSKANTHRVDALAALLGAQAAAELAQQIAKPGEYANDAAVVAAFPGAATPYIYLKTGGELRVLFEDSPPTSTPFTPFPPSTKPQVETGTDNATAVTPLAMSDVKNDASIRVVDTKAQLLLLDSTLPARIKAVIVRDTDYGAPAPLFKRVSSDISASVAADTAKAIYVPYADDPDGSSGGFVRQYHGPVNPGWFGAVFGRAVAGAVATANAAALEAANLFQAARGGGAISWIGTLEIDGSVVNSTPVCIALRGLVALVGEKPEHGWAVYPEVGVDQSGTQLRLASGTNKSLVGFNGRGEGLHNLVLDCNKSGNPNPGCHGVYGTGGSGVGDGTSMSGVRCENATGFSVFAYDIDPLTVTNCAFREGVFFGGQADTILTACQIEGGHPRPLTFDAAADVDDPNNKFTKTNHGLYNGLKVKYANGGGTTVIGLNNGSSYFVVNATEDEFQLSSTYGGGALSIADGAGAAHTLTADGHGPGLLIDGSNYNHIVNNICFGPGSAPIKSTTFTAATNDEITPADDTWLYENRPVMVSNSGGAPPGGLDIYTVYYLRKVSAGKWNFYDSPHAANGVKVDITSAGTGTHTLKTGVYDETFLYVGGGGAIVAANRFAGTWGAGATLVDPFDVHWSDNHVYETQKGRSDVVDIETVTADATDTIGLPYVSQVEFNVDDATGGDAPISLNQHNIISSIVQQNEPTGGIWRVFLNKKFRKVTDLQVVTTPYFTHDFRVGGIGVSPTSVPGNFFDIYVYDIATNALAHPNINCRMFIRHK